MQLVLFFLESREASRFKRRQAVSQFKGTGNQVFCYIAEVAYKVRRQKNSETPLVSRRTGDI